MLIGKLQLDAARIRDTVLNRSVSKLCLLKEIWWALLFDMRKIQKLIIIYKYNNGHFSEY